MKIYGKTFLYFGSSLKTVWETRDAQRGERRGIGGELSWATALNFCLTCSLLFRNLLKNRFQSIKCGPIQKVSLLTVPQILRLFSKSTRLEAPVAWSSSQASPSLATVGLSASPLSLSLSFYPQCQFLSSSQLSAWLCRTLLPLKKARKNGSWKRRVSSEVDWAIPYAAYHKCRMGKL